MHKNQNEVTMKSKQVLIAIIAGICFSACKNEKLAIAGSGWNDIAIIDKKTGVIEWKHTLEPGDECNKIEIMPDGNVLFAYSKGAKLINRDHETIWDYKAKENEEIHSASRLKDGNYLIGICGEPARIVELDPSGKQTKEITFPTIIFDVHEQFRQIAKNDSGFYFVPLHEKQKVLMLSPEGRIIRTILIGSRLFSVKILKNNKLLVSCGKDSRFVEVDPANPQKDYFIFTNEIYGGVLRYVAEIIMYKNGNKLIANSNLYSNDKSQPLLLEIDKDNHVVWRLPYNKEIKNITSVHSFFE